MHGTRERHVIRWDAHLALLNQEIERLEQALAQAMPDTPVYDDLRDQLNRALSRKRSLGPSPRHKMG